MLSNVASTANDIQLRFGKAWEALNGLNKIWTAKSKFVNAFQYLQKNKQKRPPGNPGHTVVHMILSNIISAKQTTCAEQSALLQTNYFIY